MLTKACRDCEVWSEKDIIYVVGVANNNALKSLWFVYGDCYAADKETYTRVKEKISSGINDIEGVEFSETKELGRINKVDLLGITYLRVRGMWGIDNPSSVFDHIVKPKNEKGFDFNAIISANKYNSFPEKDRVDFEKLQNNSKLKKNLVKIQSPNNLAELVKAYHISFSV